jgi:hypothetical protein
MAKNAKSRSYQVQIKRMEHRWPDLAPRLVGGNKFIAWIGPLRGFQMKYKIAVVWSWLNPKSAPLVYVLEPTLKPRLGTDFIDLPHLNYDSERPEDSALCLFDPDIGEWDNTMLIADRIVPWASEWLHYYEIWHLDGVWHGSNAPGPISVGEILRQRQEVGDGTGA